SDLWAGRPGRLGGDQGFLLEVSRHEGEREALPRCPGVDVGRDGGVSVSSDRLSEVDAQIARLQEERNKLAADPERLVVRGLYEELERVLDRLAELGEDVTTDEGQVVTVLGTRFYYVHGCTLRER